MNEPPLIARERASLRALIEHTRARAETENQLGSLFAKRKLKLEHNERDRAKQLELRLAALREEAQTHISQVRHEIPARAEQARAEAIAQELADRRSIKGAFKRDSTAAQETHDQARWEASTVYEAAISDADQTLKELTKRKEKLESQLQTLRSGLDQVLDRSHMRGVERAIRAVEEPRAERGVQGDPLLALESELARLDQGLEGLERLPLLKLFRDGNFALIFVVLAILTIVPAVMALDLGKGIFLGGGITIVVGSLVTLGLYFQARRQVRDRLPAVRDALRSSEQDLDDASGRIARDDADRREAAKRRQVAEVRQAGRTLATVASALETQREESLRQLATRHAARLDEIASSEADDLAREEAAHAARIANLDRQDVSEREALKADLARERERYTAEESAAWTNLATQWQSAMNDWSIAVDEVKGQESRWYPNWDQPEVPWSPPEQVAPALRFGGLDVNREAMPHGLPREERLRTDAPERVLLPALLGFPDGAGSLILRAYGEGRQAAIPVLQSLMLRALTCAPPGKVRFTIIDPVGLGHNFAAFMHLADHDEQLVTSRIWTEGPHIERKLAELTEHMEKVIQKYLRNEFGTIQEYNAQAGEVAEPFRILVVANFPVNFSDSAARRLVSICQSGPRCGVYTFLSADEREAMPAGVTLADLEAGATLLAWRDGRFAWKDEDFGAYPLALESPPSDESLTRLLNEVGARARDAARVEVPFHVVAPRPDQIWTADSRAGVQVPLGRVGANKLQDLKLGEGTSQHVLIAGRTGSGKSTLLHALIVNSALRYRPDELELYLIDFKKGVEFKPYVTWQLPHARVVAIESEREFGLSVLGRLDEEMKRRGELFRAMDVPNIAGYRDAKPNERLPRILLIVDEFQEFFVEDDKLAQDAALLMDRLVRQGRAFGIHILLGSQTLGGAFSLARSTLGQMGVRIALQCSESDAHLILSEDNGAARLLSRPGEAIYNDANGMLEGNNFFQVVWLPDERREEYLKSIQELQAQTPAVAPPSQIVFEGNIPADLARNAPISAALTEGPPAEPPRVPVLWLGDAVAIKDPTAAPFRRQAGANLLIIGQNEEAAMSLLLSGLASLRAQYGPSAGQDASDWTVQAVVLDGSRDDSPVHGLPRRHDEALGIPIHHAGWRDAAEALDMVSRELDRRETAASFEDRPIFLFIHDLARFRDLRKSEDDYGFGASRGDEPEKPDPSKQFARILRDGPGFGIHTILWCDSLNNLQRALDRATVREFEMRILFQMSPNDSSALIDSPAAGRLGQNRAYFAHQEEGLLEKFRPYGIPSPAWWERLRDSAKGHRGGVGVKDRS